MLANSATRRLFRVGLGIDNRGETALHRAPVIQDAGNMSHFLIAKFFNATQRKVIILRAFVALPQSAYLAQKRSAINAEVIDVILTEKKLRIPIGFEERVRARAVVVDLVLVGIDQSSFRMFRNFQGNQGKRVPGKRIVLIEQRTPFTGGEG